MALSVAFDAERSSKYPYRYDGTIALSAPIEQVFAHLDDPRRLGGHMTESSWQMGGGRMTFELDDGQGQRLGSVIKLGGRVLGIELSVEEAIVERAPPYRKVWETIGAPRLLVIGSYRMGYEISPRPEGCQLRVFIEYEMPVSGFARLFGRLLGRFYAKWCTEQMLKDAQEHFLGGQHR